MFRIDRRKSVTGEVLQDERTAYDSILKATAQKTRGKEINSGSVNLYWLAETLISAK